MDTLRRHPLLAGALVLVALQALLVAAAPWVSPYDPLQQDVLARREA